jgi:hypothetical protein
MRHPDTQLQDIGRWCGRAFSDSIKPFGPPLYRIFEPPLSEIQRLITGEKSEMLDMSIRSFQCCISISEENAQTIRLVTTYASGYAVAL